MSKPQVLIDGTVFEGRGRIGIWRLFYETMSRTSAEVDYTLLLGNAPDQPVPAGVNVAHFARGPELVSRRHVYWNLTQSIRQSRLRSRFPTHIWHPTFFSLDPREPSDAAQRPKRMVTVYDMLSEDYYWMGDFALQRAIKQRCIEQSDHAIAISESTERRLLKYFPDLSGRTNVVHLAADHTGDFTPASSSSKTLDGSANESPNESPEPYCLFVGGRDLYKHFEFAVRAIASARWPVDLSMKVIGRPFSEAETQYIRAHGVQDKIQLLDSVSDSDLFEYYRRATCFVFPSLEEGFGLPVLEAQQNDCIPVLSDIPVFREVGGKGAAYYSPHDIDAFIDAVTSTRDQTDRKRLLLSAEENVKHFSWDRCAEKVLQCYETLWGSQSRQTTS